jgi:hypothetical protein
MDIIKHPAQDEFRDQSGVCLLAVGQEIEVLELVLDPVVHSSRDGGMPEPRHADDSRVWTRHEIVQMLEFSIRQLRHAACRAALILRRRAALPSQNLLQVVCNMLVALELLFGILVQLQRCGRIDFQILGSGLGSRAMHRLHAPANAHSRDHAERFGLLALQHHVLRLLQLLAQAVVLNLHALERGGM